jgi:hypothetical protein
VQAASASAPAVAMANANRRYDALWYETPMGASSPKAGGKRNRARFTASTFRLCFKLHPRN